MSEHTKDLMEVAKELDEFQRHYAEKVRDPEGMPGNELYREKLMAIVRHAREVLWKIKGEI